MYNLAVKACTESLHGELERSGEQGEEDLPWCRESLQGERVSHCGGGHGGMHGGGGE